MKLYNIKIHQYFSFLLLFLFIGFSGINVFAQASKNKEAGEIVMTVEELESLLSKIAKQRQAVLNNRANNVPIIQQRNSINVQNQNMYQDFKDLEYKVDLLLSKSNIIPNNGSNTTYILPSQSSGLVALPTNPKATNNLPIQNSQLAGLPSDPNTDINLNTQNPQVLAKTSVSTGMNNLEVYRKVLKSHQVFFANNSVSINSIDKKIIADFIPLITENKNRVILVLKGFASQLGKPFYNNQLSYNRADAIKQLLINNGISPSNILILNHGADSTVTEAEARRVEISLELIN